MMIGLLLIAVFLMLGECVWAEDRMDFPTIGEDDFFGPIVIACVGAVVSSVVCTGFNAVHLARGNPSLGWGIGGAVSAAALGILYGAWADSEDVDDGTLYFAYSLAAVTAVAGILNITGDRGRQETSDQKISLLAGMRPDGPRSLQPSFGLVWRF
jgi:hypothetical protein